MTDTPTPPVLDMQDPLPESNWLWRRALTFTAILLVFALMIGLAIAVNRIVGSVTERIDNMNAAAVASITIRALDVIENMFKWMFWSLAMVVTYYMIAPSAEQIAKMIGAVKLLRGGVQTASRRLVDESRGITETATTVGTPPQPAVPEVTSETETDYAPRSKQ